ncbi:MAG: HAMP domain-containing histidine kinase [Oscillospiraceae bacterium]|nr:HAMP domain-containing histidine kinase [Oscillospiraceae bacterium]
MPKLKFSPLKGITRRWIANSVFVIVIVIFLCVFGFSVFIRSYFYSNISEGLRSKSKTAASFLTNYVTQTYAEYYDTAYSYTENFDDAGHLELQFINTRGHIEVSSIGMAAGSSPGTPDISSALSNGNTSVWYGRSPQTGERIIAVSSPLIYGNGETIGIMRYVSSLQKVNNLVTVYTVVAVAVGIAIILMVIFTNMFFIRSVVKPVNEITSVAKRIAEGSYGIQMNQTYTDEIADMVDAINEMSLKISQSEKAQAEFVSSISHELRTPLTAISGWGETLTYDESLTGEAKKGARIILKEARRLTKMVEELLDFTRMQDGRFTLNVERIDVGAELEEAIFTYREVLRQDDIDLEYEPCMYDLPLINGDPERLRQVFLNILDNAAKYGRDGKRIIVTIDSDASYISIKVRDFGPGIPENELEHVKKKFYKGNYTQRGSGIGLAVCDEIVKYHGGTLTLANAEGGGTLVTVRLPIEL